MSKALVFDTLAYSNKLKEAGVPAKQAEAQAQVLAEVIGDQLATKQDIELKLTEFKNELIKWVLGISIAQSAIIISCLKLIH